MISAVLLADSATADGAIQMDKQMEEAGNAGIHDHSSMLNLFPSNCWSCGGRQCRLKCHCYLIPDTHSNLHPPCLIASKYVNMTGWDAEIVVELLSQLQLSESGSVDDRQLEAATQLADLVDNGQQIQDAIVAAGVAPMLAAWLKSEQPDPRFTAIRLLTHLVYSQNSTDAFLSTEVLQTITSCLESAEPLLQFEAVAALGAFANGSHEICEAMVAAGCLPVLADWLSSDQPRVQACAASALAHIMYKQQDVGAVQLPNFVSACISALMSDHEFAQHMAAIADGRVAMSGRQGEHYTDELITAGVPPLLATIIQSAKGCLQCVAGAALARLLHTSPQNQAAVCNQFEPAEAVPAFAALLQSDGCEPDVKWAALTVITTVAEYSQHSKASICPVGVVPILTAELSSSHFGLQNQAAAAIGNIGRGSQAIKDAIVASGALPLLVGLLASGQEDGCSVAAGTLAELAHESQTTGDAIIAAGALPALVALMSSEALDEHRKQLLLLQGLLLDPMEAKRLS